MNNPRGLPVAVIIGATSKWQSDGRNTLLAHGQTITDEDMPVAKRWGIGGALAHKFADQGFFVVVTSRQSANAEALLNSLPDDASAVVELDFS